MKGFKREFKEELRKIFSELNDRIDFINHERRKSELFGVPKAKVQLLGQISLLVHKKVSVFLSLAQTADLDAFITMDEVIKKEFKKILKEKGLIYDEDSYLIWIPPGSKFEKLFAFNNIDVEVIDPESALVSKAVKAVQKNKQLIREAIASEKFPKLVDRILKNGGNLKDFV